jgi:hypothetical protein
MPTISVIINADTRPQRDEQTGLFSGVCNEDFLIDGIFNKIQFFKGFDIETIVFIDEHLPVPDKTLEYLRSMCDCVVIRKHTKEEKFNDWNYWSALMLARGTYIAHFDQDSAAFTSSPEAVQDFINGLEVYDFISYPSHWSPAPVHDPNYDYYWCSTRFFMCKRETLDFTEIKKCLQDSDYLYGKYPASVRTPWAEHILGLISKYTGKGVYYPPIQLDRIAIFSWANYEQWVLRRLNEYSYGQIVEFINSKGGIQYPNDIRL